MLHIEFSISEVIVVEQAH